MNGFWLASRTSVPLTLNGPVSLPQAAPAFVVAPLPVPPPAPVPPPLPAAVPLPTAVPTPACAGGAAAVPATAAASASAEPATKPAACASQACPRHESTSKWPPGWGASCPHVATRAITSVPLSGDGAGYGTLRRNHSALPMARDAVVTVPISPAGTGPVSPAPPRPNPR